MSSTPAPNTHINKEASKPVYKSYPQTRDSHTLKHTKTPLTVKSVSICWPAVNSWLTWASLSICPCWIPVCLFAWGQRSISVRGGEGRGREGRIWQRRGEQRGIYLQENNQKSLEVAWSVTRNILLQVIIMLWETKYVYKCMYDPALEVNLKYSSQQIDCLQTDLKVPETNNHSTRMGRVGWYTNTR